MGVLGIQQVYIYIYIYLHMWIFRDEDEPGYLGEWKIRWK